MDDVDKLEEYIRSYAQEWFKDLYVPGGAAVYVMPHLPAEAYRAGVIELAQIRWGILKLSIEFDRFTRAVDPKDMKPPFFRLRNHHEVIVWTGKSARDVREQAANYWHQLMSESDRMYVVTEQRNQIIRRLQDMEESTLDKEGHQRFAFVKRRWRIEVEKIFRIKDTDIAVATSGVTADPLTFKCIHLGEFRKGSFDTKPDHFTVHLTKSFLPASFELCLKNFLKEEG